MDASDQEPEWTATSVVIAIAIVIGLFFLFAQAYLWISGSFNRYQAAQAASRPVSIAELDHDAQFKAMNAKMSPNIAAPLDRGSDPEGYKKLGKRVWAVSNEFRRWAALAAAQSDSCDKVGSVANWERATREDLVWRVGCTNGEVFLISGEQARSVRAQFDQEATLEDRKEHAALITIAQPVSRTWEMFSVPTAVVTCENVMEQAAVDRSSFNGEGRWSVARDVEGGTATIERGYSAANALGGTLSGAYQCIVSAKDGSVTSLKAQDAFGTHVIL